MSSPIDVVLIGDNRAALKLRIEGAPPINIEFERGKLLEFIQLLGSVHAQMFDGQPTPPIAGARLNISHGVTWYTQPLEDGSMFAFWDRGFGPVAIHLHPEEVETLHTLLSRQIEARRRPSGPGH